MHRLMESLSTNSFLPANKAAWLTQVENELKSARTAATDQNTAAYETLRWPTGNGFIAEPYYTADDLASLPITEIQAVQKQTPGWLNAPEQAVSDDRGMNAALRHTLSHGADALVVVLVNQSDLPKLLHGIKLSETPVFFKTNDPARLTTTLKTVAPYQLRGGLLTDPIAHWLQTGQPVEEGTWQAVADAINTTADSPQFRTICVSSHVFHNAGATATQELAFLLASLADQYDKLTDTGLTIDQLIPKTILSVSVGTSYFLEIAKLRALRVLHNRLLAAYHSSLLTHHSSLIHAQTSTFYDAIATPYTNLLRATTEAMAAVVGGCDVLTVHPYDAVLNKQADREFSERMARNVSLLLREESYLDKVADPSAGSYYIENLTHQFIEAAWALFLDVEQRGGFMKAFTDGFIPAEIERAYQAKVEAVKNGNVLVGVTKFRFDEPTDHTDNIADNQAGLLPNRRLAQAFE